VHLRLEGSGFSKLEVSLKSLLFFSLAWVGARAIGDSLIYLYFWNSGVSALEIVFSVATWFAAPLIGLLLLNNRKGLGSRLFFKAALLLGAFSFALLAALPPSGLLLGGFSFISGLSGLFFWLPFNELFFARSKDRAAFAGAAYSGIGPSVGVVLPLLAGTVSSIFGFPALFVLSGVCALAAWIALPKMDDFTQDFDLRKSLSDAKEMGALFFWKELFSRAFQPQSCWLQ